MLTGFRFREEINVLPWLKFNLTKTGVSATIGPDAAHITVGRGGTWVYVDVPGEGTYFRRKLQPLLRDLSGEEDAKGQKSDDKGKDTDAAAQEASEAVPAAVIEDYNLLNRMTAAPGQNAFVDGVRALNEADLATAYTRAREAAIHADGAFLAGFLAIQHQDWQPAVEYFERALSDRDHLGEWFARFEVNLNVYVPVARGFMVAIQPTRRDCILSLAIIHERLHHNEQAIAYLQHIRQHYDPDDLIIRLLLAELLDETYPNHPRVQHEIVTLAEGVQNDSPLHASLMYYRGRALRRLGVLGGARDTLTKALRKKKDYPSDLLVSLRYERALLYQEEGNDKRAHEEFEKIYAQAPQLEDVAARLGLMPEINQPPPPGPLRVQQPGSLPEVETPPDLPVDFELENLSRQS